MFEAETHGIRVEVEPAYVHEQSNPNNDYFFFAYSVRITNKSPRDVQLVSRHWIITDAFGSMEEVQGPGVIGQQPLIRPGESFEYSSFCPLNTPTGSMRGTYTMKDTGGVEIVVEIPLFILSEPSHFH